MNRNRYHRRHTGQCPSDSCLPSMPRTIGTGISSPQSQRNQHASSMSRARSVEESNVGNDCDRRGVTISGHIAEIAFCCQGVTYMGPERNTPGGLVSFWGASSCT